VKTGEGVNGGAALSGAGFYCCNERSNGFLCAQMSQALCGLATDEMMWIVL